MPELMLLAAIWDKMDKAFFEESEFTAWGTHVASKCGRVGTPTPKLCHIAAVTTALLACVVVSKKSMQKVLGLFVHPYQHRREFMSIFDTAYLWTHHLRERGLFTLTRTVRDELIAATLMLPFAHAIITWQVQERIATTDATPVAGGGTATHIPASAAEMFSRSQ